VGVRGWTFKRAGIPLYLAILSTHIVTFLAVELLPDEE
jgi:hypothetical protein